MARHDVKAGKTLGQIVRERRIQLGLTQEELAERMGEHVRQSDVSRMERDYITLPRRDRLEALAQALEVSPGYLLLHSGWMSGDEQETLESALSPEPAAMAEDAPSAGHVPAPREESPDLLPSPPVSSRDAETPSLLSLALVRARQESHRTDEILRRTAETLERARRIRRRP